MRRLVFSARAQRDIWELWGYIAADNITAADKLCDKIKAAVELLGEMPGAGHTRPDVKDQRYRFWSVRPTSSSTGTRRARLR